MEKKKSNIRVLLIDDQRTIGIVVGSMLKEENDIDLNFYNTADKAKAAVNEINPTVILQDLVMPDADGIEMVKYFRSNPSTKNVPIIVLSSEENASIKAESFKCGANDYLVKLPDKLELNARIRYHSASYSNLIERDKAYEELLKSQHKLAEELKRAANYVLSLLPKPLTGELTADWIFIPSDDLGGDSFGYRWIDEDNFAIFLLDVCGHGIGAALLSISIMNVLNSSKMLNVDYRDPSQVLYGLNETFQMEKHGNMFFTFWYGVYNKKLRALYYASAGHPPAILISGDSEFSKKIHRLAIKKNSVIGVTQGVSFESDVVEIGIYNSLYVFSDGVFEIPISETDTLSFNDFESLLINNYKHKQITINDIHSEIRKINFFKTFSDDFSILQIIFN
ncbi:MAG TPA: SpoIIE family protein phosphatase [bacterium]|nr:SpoIIE family protein phosphatase [bacterium]